MIDDTANVLSAGSVWVESAGSPGSAGVLLVGAGSAGAAGGPRTSPMRPPPPPGAGVVVGVMSAGARPVSWTSMTMREASTPLLGMGLVASPCTLPVSWGTAVGGVSLKLHCTRVSTRCWCHWSAPEASAPTQPGVIDTAVTTMVRPRLITRNWPTLPPVTQTHAWVESGPATDCAAVEPGRHPTDVAV